MIQKVRTFMDRPAWFSFAGRVTRALRSRFSASWSCCMICLRRVSGVFATALRDAWAFGFRLPKD
jgi:hypothetical protein